MRLIGGVNLRITKRKFQAIGTYPNTDGKKAMRRKSNKRWQHECQLYQQRKEFWQKYMKLPERTVYAKDTHLHELTPDGHIVRSDPKQAAGSNPVKAVRKIFSARTICLS